MLTRLLSTGHLSKKPAPGQRRAIALNLMIFFAFALISLVLLTRSAISANAINRDVSFAIAPATQGINASTKKIPQLNETMVLTSKIAGGTNSLSGHLGHVVTATNNIDANLGAVSRDVSLIGGAVDGIHDTVGRIKPAISTLADSVDGIHTKAGDISSSLGQVAIDTSVMNQSLAGINSSLASVLANTAPLLGDVSGIRSTLATVNGYTLSIANSPILLSKFPFPGLQVPGALGSLGLNNLLGGG